MTIQYTAHPADPASSAVLTRGLVKRYGDFLAVNGLNLNVPAHGVYGLLGKWRRRTWSACAIAMV